MGRGGRVRRVKASGKGRASTRVKASTRASSSSAVSWDRSSGEGEFELNETTEMELASELLEVSSEQELEQFLGKLVKGAGKFLKSGTGKALTGILKNVAKKALPVVGGALGSFVAPGIGTALGSKLGSAASNLFELEYEGMSEQELEFEVARRVVRLRRERRPSGVAEPARQHARAVAANAVASAARSHAPGLVRGTPMRGASRNGARWPRRASADRRSAGNGPRPSPRSAADHGVLAAPARARGTAAWVPTTATDDGSGGMAGSRSGRWVRRGRTLVLFGA